jgi:hypothetical protein
MKRAGFVVDHPAAHRDGVFQDLISEADLLERVNAAGGKGEIDRAAADKIAFARVGAAFKQVDLVTAAAEERSEQSTGKSASDKNKFGHNQEWTNRERRKAGIEAKCGGCFTSQTANGIITAGVSRRSR